ncbi:MAG: Peptidoglycan glycosyltransferase [Clostridia bacterium 41_269]|nr:MAG: Peptidoglycan glycosyltransferase [Clostridia bacterium 41_269]
MGLKRGRLIFLLVIFNLILILLLFRLVELQIFGGKSLAIKAQESRFRLISGEDYPRGQILDRNGISLTDSGIRPALIIFPYMIKEKDEFSSLISKILGVSKDLLKDSLNKKKYLIIPNLSNEQIKKIKNLNLEGTLIISFKTRYGPNSLSRHLVGHINSIDLETWKTIQNKTFFKKEYNINDFIGVKGIEVLYEKYLRLEDPLFYWIVTVDARERIIPGLSFKRIAGYQKAGRPSVVTTLDFQIQKKVEEIMDQMVPHGAVVVMDVLNGDIIALASRPNYDQNNLAECLEVRKKPDNDPFINRAFEHYYPGSIFKVLIAAAAIEEKIVNPEDIFSCSGEYVLNPQLKIGCWKNEGHGEITFKEGFAQSCNSVFVDTALHLGRKKILEYAEKFNLVYDGALIGYPRSRFKSVDISPYGEGKMANAALGQEGVRLSPVQVAGMISVIANGGHLVVPRIVKEIKDYSGRAIISYDTEKPKRVISEKTCRIIQEMMVKTTTEGTGKKAWIPKYGSAGKTGSAETGLSIDKPKYYNWFAGYFPIEKPRFAVVVMVEGGVSGGETAAPVFREIASFLAEY